MLEIRRLRKTFGSVVAADDIELSVKSGEALGIIGPNGAGKTTLFNLIAGGLKPDAGEIRLNGRDITAAKPHQRCIVWIEHIVHALLAVVGRLSVLNFGRKIADGDPHEVMASPEVRQIYLGLSA